MKYLNTSIITCFVFFKLICVVNVCLSGQEGVVAVVAEFSNNRLALWRLRDGSVWKHFGSWGWQPGQFKRLRAVAVTKQHALVVTDAHRVQVLTLDGAVLCVLEDSAIANFRQAGLGEDLSGVAMCPNTDDILVIDYNRIVAFTCTDNPDNVRIPFDFDFVIPI